LRLALLNACEGARGGKFDVLSSTAATLVLGGLPAVLAMQYAITDTAALEFARTFYGALADNLPVDAAVADARNAINLQDEYSLEWGTPVLFMRTADGQLFTVDQTARPSTAPGQPTPAPSLPITDASITSEPLPHALLANLRDVLAVLYADEASARRVVADAGLDERRLAFTGQAINTWHAILREAANLNQVEALLQVALHDYGANHALTIAVSAYRRTMTSSAAQPGKSDAQPKPAPAAPPRKSASVPTPKAGDKRTIAVIGVDFTFVYVPAGPFIMGSEEYDEEKPVHTFQTNAFWLLQTPVTNSHYRPFVEASGYNKQAWWTPTGWQWRTNTKLTEPRYWQDKEWNEAKQPVIGVSWYEALAYANWLVQMTGESVRLPTEAEWEKGARGEKGLKYPWGDQSPTEELCNFGGKVSKTTSVDRYPKGASLYGALDMAGNIWEWTATKWLENYENYGTLVDDNPEADAGAQRVVRGGAWNHDQINVRAAYRSKITPRRRYFDLGFRVVVPVPPQKGF
jgi:formylglycine-generating enzyme required for sulfatase activity